MATTPPFTSAQDVRYHDDLNVDCNNNKSTEASMKTTVAFTLINKKAKKASENADNNKATSANVFGAERETRALNSSSVHTSQQPLVIPLTQTSVTSKLHLIRNKNHDKAQVDDADAAAIQALQDDALNVERSGEDLTIPVDQNQKEREKFRTDLEELPEEPSVDSDVYERVPISDFGAALLRGMGWKGDDDDNNNNKSGKEENMVMPRPVRLGLGATPQLKAAITHRAMRPDELRRQAALEEQQAKAMEQHELIKVKDKQQTLQDGSIVRHDQRRAKLVQLRGVPGLNRVRIVYEKAPPTDVTAVAKGEIALVSRKELDEQPFQEVIVTDQINHLGKGDKDRDQKRGNGEQTARVKEEPGFNERRIKKEDVDYRNDSRNGSGDHHQISSSREKQQQQQASQRRRPDDEERPKARDGNDDRNGRDRSSRKRSRKDEEDDHKASKKQAPAAHTHWLISSIRVRVVTEKLGKRYYQEKGVVLDVTRKGAEATLQMADGRILDHVPERYLETALPKPGGNAIVLTGPSRLAKGKLLERDSRANQGVVQVFEEMNVLTLSLDDMAEWCGPLDDDLLE